MSEEGKKVSFGFSKLVKPKISILSTSKNVKSDDSVQFIDCLEDKSIKVKNEVPKKPDLLVIPLPKQDVASGKKKELLQKILNIVDSSEEVKDQGDSVPVTVSTQSENICKNETLDEIAVREIIQDSQKVKEKEVETNNFTVPLVADETNSGKISTLDDYESIPVEKFGMAMLRGMGWAPGKGIGKTEQVISAKQPLLRPKGLGLGADKVIKQSENPTLSSEPLKLTKGSFVRIIAGVHKDTFGETIGFDDESGRLIVKMALGNDVLTFNEFMVEVISKEDFNKNSKVINVRKYEEYKNMEDIKGVVGTVSENQSESNSKDNYKKRTSSDSSRGSSRERKTFKKSQEIKDKSIKQTSRTGNRSSSEASHDNYKCTNYKSYKMSGKDRRHRSSDSSSDEKLSSNNRSSRTKTSHRSKRYSRSSSEDKSHSRNYKHVSRKEAKKRRTSSSSDSSPAKKHSQSKDSKKTKYKRDSSSSELSSSDNKKKVPHRTDYYKKKCKKNKEKKKSRRRSKSSSVDRKRRHKSPSRKHKKSKYKD